MVLSTVITIGVLIGLVVALTTRIRQDRKMLRRLKFLFLIALLFSYYLTQTSLSTRSPGIEYLNFFMGLFILFYDTNKEKRNPNDLKRQKSRRNFVAISILCVIVASIGIGAWFIDSSNPSDLDIYTESNDSAFLIILATALVLMIFGIAARFSYLKYARINQADLIADAIKTQVQTSGNRTISTAAPVETQDAEDRLRKLESLLTNGLISQDEYGQKKKEIIDSI
jgi:hypothetical protein